MRYKAEAVVISVIVICATILTLGMFYLVIRPPEQPIVTLTTPNALRSENLNELYDKAITDWRKYMPKDED